MYTSDVMQEIELQKSLISLLAAAEGCEQHESLASLTELQEELATAQGQFVA